MALSQLTPSQRTEALEKAVAVRAERGAVLAALKDGTLSLQEVLDRSHDTVVGRAKVHRLLTALPGIGKFRAAQLMTDLGISESRRVQGLGPHQRARLLARFPASS
ncbi:integration host factor, actinobacterial type [Streptomyces sp. NPDC005065]|uniref:integration host factor, actinobacterial type n=1 Tax=Streptomyces sp. NPDC005065 TaxID=3154461 RepID=UPI0033BD650C